MRGNVDGDALGLDPLGGEALGEVEKPGIGPLTTVSSGALTEAISRSPRCGVRASSDIGTDSIPPAGTVSNSLPRRWTRPMQSSNDITPARQAAVFSPIE